MPKVTTIERTEPNGDCTEAVEFLDQLRRGILYGSLNRPFKITRTRNDDGGEDITIKISPPKKKSIDTKGKTGDEGQTPEATEGSASETPQAGESVKEPKTAGGTKSTAKK